jgi:hypothetical protein
LAVVFLFAGCDAVKGLLGEDDGSSGSGGGGSNSGVSVAFEEIDVDAGGTTTLVTLVFDRDIPGLSDRDVTITDAGDTGAVAGVLSPTGVPGAYTLAVAGVKETGEIAISVGHSGYTFTPVSQKAVVNFDEMANKVTFVNAIADGTAGSQTTTELILTFNAAFATPLQPGDITLAAGSTGAVMGGLFPSGDGAFSLQVSGIAAEGEVTVTVVKEGYTVSPATVTAAVHLLTPLATGGTVTYDPPTGIPQWEIHTFTKSDTLAFSTPVGSVAADYLIVAGGGGAGGGSWWAGGGGGGAGGLLYKTGQTLALDAGSSVAVTVGAGGGGGAKQTTGANGGKSAVGSVEVPGGGGGGATLDQDKATPGLAGGSGGGGGCGYHVGSNGGAASAGYAGGKSGAGTSNTNSYSGSGGGGGAGGTGQNGYSVNQTSIVGGGGAGGTAWIATDTGAAWIAAATGKNVFSGGGKGGNFGGGSTHSTGAAGPNYGDGGSGGTGQNPGGTGHSGIVVIRFPRPN